MELIVGPEKRSETYLSWTARTLAYKCAMERVAGGGAAPSPRAPHPLAAASVTATATATSTASATATAAATTTFPPPPSPFFHCFPRFAHGGGCAPPNPL